MQHVKMVDDSANDDDNAIHRREMRQVYVYSIICLYEHANPLVF